MVRTPVHQLRNAPRLGITTKCLVPVVVNLANILCEVAVLLEPLRHRHDVRTSQSQVGSNVPDGKRIRAASTRERHLRRITDWLLTISTLKDDATRASRSRLGVRAIRSP